jgi:hypothetical protein
VKWQVGLLKSIRRNGRIRLLTRSRNEGLQGVGFGPKTMGLSEGLFRGTFDENEGTFANVVAEG